MTGPAAALTGRPAAAREAARSLTTVVISWNTADLLDECLRSVQASVGELSHEVVVVDNGSTDGSLDLLARHWPGVQVIANDHNAGYTRATNQAVRVATGDYLLLINTDAFLQPGALTRMMSVLDGDPSLAVVGPRLVYRDGSFQRWTGGRHPGLRSAAVYFSGLDRVRRFARAGIFLGADLAAAIDTDWVSSACLLVRRSALPSSAPMDESFFCYMDDVDLCAKLRRAGWRVRYDPAAVVTHLMGGSRPRAGATNPMALHAFNRYFDREHAGPSRLALRLLETTGFAARAAAYGLASLRPEAAPRRAAARAHWNNAVTCIGRTPA